MDEQQKQQFLIQMELKMAILGDDAETIEFLVQNGADINARTVNTSTLIFVALEAKKFDNVLLLLKLGADIGAVKTTGPLADYTLLHIACKEGYADLVRLLVCEHDATPNAIAADSARPIHLAALHGHTEIINFLLSVGADIDAKFNYAYNERYLSDSKWCSDFYKENSLLTHAVINHDLNLIKVLIQCNADVRVRSIENKTLLMYAVEDNALEVVKLLLSRLDESDINRCDNNGFTAIHYLIQENVEESSLSATDAVAQMHQKKCCILKELIKSNINVNAVVDQNPDTLLINMVAYSGFVDMLEILLANPTSTLARPLCYSLSSKENIWASYQRKMDTLENFERNIESCIRCSLEDVFFKEEMGLFVAEEEIKAKKKLFELQTDAEIYILKHRYTISLLKEEKLATKSVDTCIYDIVTKSWPIFESLVLYPKAIEILDYYYPSNGIGYFKRLIQARLEAVQRHVYLEDEIVSDDNHGCQFDAAITCVKDIIECMDDMDF